MYLENLVIDAAEPQRLGRFWEAVVGGERLTDEPDIFETRLTIEGGPVLDLCFPARPAPPTSRRGSTSTSRAAARQAEEVERLLGLGARTPRHRPGRRAVGGARRPGGQSVPRARRIERRTPQRTRRGAAARLRRPDRDAEFWSWLTGWTDVAGAAPLSLRHPSRRGPLLELRPEAAPNGRGEEPAAPRRPARVRGGRRRVAAADPRAPRPRAPPRTGASCRRAPHRPLRQRVLRPPCPAVVREGRHPLRRAGRRPAAAAGRPR